MVQGLITVNHRTGGGSPRHRVRYAGLPPYAIHVVDVRHSAVLGITVRIEAAAVSLATTQDLCSCVGAFDQIIRTACRFEHGSHQYFYWEHFMIGWTGGVHDEACSKASDGGQLLLGCLMRTL